jgi:RNA polymerase sigma-70 factor (TIGR02960 family)
VDRARRAATRSADQQLSVDLEATASDRSALFAARTGDEQAFVRLTAPHRQPLHRHCYRILGSLHDADDALQETMLRAWRGINGFQPRAPLRSWLYRIATNVCLRMLEQRAREPAAAVDTHLEPYPDLLLDEVASPAPGPEESVEERERIGLAFVAAMQLLPPKQRVTVVLRDVLDWSAREVAELLDDTVPAVNSALQRGRDRLERERQERSLLRAHAPANAAEEQRVMRQFQEAWTAVDFDGIVALLSDDALLTMPPEAGRFEGSAQISGFFATAPLDGRLDRIQLIRIRANRQPALAAYADEHGDGVFEAYGVMVFAIRGDRIDGITGFARQPTLFTRLGLPIRLAASADREG